MRLPKTRAVHFPKNVPLLMPSDIERAIHVRLPLQERAQTFTARRNLAAGCFIQNRDAWIALPVRRFRCHEPSRFKIAGIWVAPRPARFWKEAICRIKDVLSLQIRMAK